MAEKTSTERKRRMIDILVKCSPKKRIFNEFCDALVTAKCEEARDILRQDFEKHLQEIIRSPVTASGRFLECSLIM